MRATCSVKGATMKKSMPAPDPDAYVRALDGWRADCVEMLRAAVRKSAAFEEVIKWGHLVYVKGSTLVAVPFDLARMEVRGTPVPVLTRLATMSIGSGHFDVAADGTLLYLDADSRDAAAATARTLVWVDRQGLETPLSASLPARPYGQPRVSPDGTHIAVAINDQENDIWVWDVVRQTPFESDVPRVDVAAVDVVDFGCVLRRRAIQRHSARADVRADNQGNPLLEQVVIPE